MDKEKRKRQFLEMAENFDKLPERLQGHIEGVVTTIAAMHEKSMERAESETEAG